MLTKPAGWPLFAIVVAVLACASMAVLIDAYVEWTTHRTAAGGATTTTRKRVTFGRGRE